VILSDEIDEEEWHQGAHNCKNHSNEIRESISISL